MRRLLLIPFLAGVALTVGCDGDDEGPDGSIRDATPGADGGVSDGGGGGADAGTLRDGGVPDAAPIGRCDPNNGGITLPEGFCAAVFADGLGRARHMAVTPSGDLFVAINNAPAGTTTTSTGGIVALRDSDGDGRADHVERFGDNGGNGIAWRDGQLYFATNATIVRYALPDGELLPALPPEVVVSGLASGGDHPYKTIVFTSSAVAGQAMYVNIGSATNSCQEQNRVPGSPGIALCPELATRAGVWRFPVDQLGLTQQDGGRLVTGTRNLNAMAVRPGTSRLYAVQNGRDELFESWPDIYTMEQGLRLPSETMFFLEGGADYGWPYCYHDPELPGYNVVFQPFEMDLPTEDYEVFAAGFAGDGRPLPEMAEHRPVGVTVAPDGSLYISDDVGGRIWRVWYWMTAP
jgi:glucose/arabinose dehydrogenase